MDFTKEELQELIMSLDMRRGFLKKELGSTRNASYEAKVSKMIETNFSLTMMLEDALKKLS